MKVYAVKEYAPYETPDVLNLYSELDLAKSAINELIKDYDEGEYIESQEEELYGVYTEYGRGFYVDVYEVITE